jgi:broad specificity phosphatase PhoE
MILTDLTEKPPCNCPHRSHPQTERATEGEGEDQRQTSNRCRKAAMETARLHRSKQDMELVTHGIVCILKEEMNYERTNAREIMF